MQWSYVCAIILLMQSFHWCSHLSTFDHAILKSEPQLFQHTRIFVYVMREHLFWTGDNIQNKKLVKFLSFHETKVNIRGSGLVYTKIVEIEARTRRWVDLFSFNKEIKIKLSNLYVQGNTYISPLSFTSYKPHNMVQKCIWTLQQHFTTQCQPADLIACCWKNFPIF